MDILTEAPNLLKRVQEGDALKLYLRQRLELIIPAMLVFLAFSLVITASTVIFVGGTRSFVVLLALIVAPFILIGSLFVQGYVFFSWLELRAIARLAGHPPRLPPGKPSLPGLRAALGRLPEIPWGLAAMFLLLPFLPLAALSIQWALLVLVAWLLTPIAYSLLDR